MSRGFPNKKYDVIYADPPWPVKKGYRKVRPNQVFMDYPTMTLEEIKDLPVPSIASDNCVLFLWTIQRFLKDAFDITEVWGFRPHITVTWDKGNGMCLFGFHRRTEFLLFGYRGKMPPHPRRKAFPTLVQAKSNKHSRKPQRFRDLILPFGSTRIELFAREHTPGWDVWGNEIERGFKSCQEQT